MKIACKLIREGGTKVEFGSKVYHFKPDPEFGGKHVADVSDKEHVGRLLSISEAYEMADNDAPAPLQPPVEPPKNQKPEQPEQPKQTEQPEQNGDADEGDTSQPDGFDDMDRAALVDIYTDRFGSPPPARIGKQGLIASLREKAAA